ncbi:MAG: ribosome maturation factor RimM [Acidimicrobiia bacterium]
MEPILVGYVRRAHGINGAVVVRPLTDDPENRWVAGAEFESDAAPPQSYTVVEASPYRDDLLVRFEEVADRNGAEALRGTSFTIDRGDRRDLEDGEFWVEDLVGCAVVDEHGTSMGVVDEVVLAAAQDRLAVRTESGRVEIPFVDAIVPEIDLERRVVVVTPPAGLFDLPGIVDGPVE